MEKKKGSTRATHTKLSGRWENVVGCKENGVTMSLLILLSRMPYQNGKCSEELSMLLVSSNFFSILAEILKLKMILQSLPFDSVLVCKFKVEISSLYLWIVFSFFRTWLKVSSRWCNVLYLAAELLTLGDFLWIDL